MQKRTLLLILRILMIAGLVSALLLCGIRSGMELKDDRVAIVMTPDSAAALGGLPDGIYPFDGALRQPDAYVLVEDENQYSYAPDPAADALLGDAPASEAGGTVCVRCFHLTEKYASRYNYLGYAGAEEIENILYRAATDRNIRLLWLEPFIDSETGKTVTDPAVYSALADALSARLHRQGLTLGPDYSVFAPYSPNILLLILTAFGIAAAGVLLLSEGFGLKNGLCLLLLVLGCLACAGLMLKKQDLAVTLTAFGAAVIFPCLALTWTVRRLGSLTDRTLGSELGYSAATLAAGFLIALAGGLAVSALQSSTEWLLAIRNFRGVKLSAALPLLYAVYIVLRRLCPPKEILKGKKFLLLLVLLALAAAVIIFLLRTGDGLLSVSGLEQRLRNFLERRLLVRPRSKEFLVAWPCFGLAAGLCARRAKRWSWPFVILTAPGFSSVVNTFCHSRAPVWLSAVRGIYGLIIGLALALVISALLHRRSPEE